ncbi:hypothetical protein [Thermaerobacter composti]|uniref:Transposase n=1 Tax=Thermaerobacter composti TaxID=554949 RepID=A0ABZ0QSW4_9FIRM|nr:hypothetical protein [Thermaerobacter composti]WPD20198.1 hypothetical protein Q5761_06090 [Thermaerobacter composti]
MAPRGGRRPREKGIRAERELARMLGGRRVPLSGAAGGAFRGDVQALGLTWQAKVEATGFRRLYKWLEGHDALGLKADRREWLVVMPLYTFLAILEDVRAGREPRQDQEGKGDGTARAG